jgi:8-oxo-dGTP pyrophosphatase MutT (NUDIX family)
MHETLIAERERKSFKLLNGWANEIFAVYGPEKELILSIERVAAPLFGIVTYGVQLLAYQQPSEGVYKIWIARRAKTKRTYPSMLDSTVGGSLPTGEKPFECLIRESIEEASFPEELVRAHAKACGTVNYVCLTDHRAGGEVGLMCPEVQFTYEIQLPEDITPVPGDGEAESIILFTIDELKSALAKGDFTPANGCIVLDFFVRHGIITYENEKDYIDIASRLHRVLEFPTA